MLKVYHYFLNMAWPTVLIFIISSTENSFISFYNGLALFQLKLLINSFSGFAEWNILVKNLGRKSDYVGGDQNGWKNLLAIWKPSPRYFLPTSICLLPPNYNCLEWLFAPSPNPFSYTYHKDMNFLVTL